MRVRREQACADGSGISRKRCRADRRRAGAFTVQKGHQAGAGKTAV